MRKCEIQITTMVEDNWNTAQNLVIYFGNGVRSLLRKHRLWRHEWVALCQCDVTRGGVWEWADRCGIFRSTFTSVSTVIFVRLPCTSCTPPTSSVRHVCFDCEFSIRTLIQRQTSFRELWCETQPCELVWWKKSSTIFTVSWSCLW
jgi:hypothetical protein